MKHVGRYNPMGRNLLRRQYWVDSKFPRCDAIDEDSYHVVTCLQPKAHKLRGDLILKTSEDIMKYGTAYDIPTTIVLTMFDNEDGSFTNNVPEFDDSYPYAIYLMIKQAAKEQDEIGRRNFFDGHILTAWLRAQESYY